MAAPSYSATEISRPPEGTSLTTNVKNWLASNTGMPGVKIRNHVIVKFAGQLLAGTQGFEPRKTDPESVVIPFHHVPVKF